MSSQICTKSYKKELIIDWYYLIIAWFTCFLNEKKELVIFRFMKMDTKLQLVIWKYSSIFLK